MMTSANTLACEPEPGVSLIMAQPSLRTVRQPGLGRITVEQTGGRSVVRSVYATSPLRLLTPKNHGHAVWIYSSSYGGGLVDGDAITIHVAVGTDSQAFLSTQSATKVYRSPRGTAVTLHADVKENGLLVCVPDAVVCYAGARYRQSQKINLASGAGLILLDWFTSGRRECGERWLFDEYLSHTAIHQDGHLMVHDALALRASDGELVTRLGRYDVMAVAVVIGQMLQGDVDRIMARVQDERVRRHADRIVTVAPVSSAGCVLRVGGQSIEDVEHTLRDLLYFVPRLLGDSPWARKW